MLDIWFWQLIVSPHMSELAVELARMGHAVTYVAEREMSTHRLNSGWSTPAMEGVTLKILADGIGVISLVKGAGANSIHICQGLRKNGFVCLAQGELTRRNLDQWVVMETVNDRGRLGFVKRLEYTRLFWARRKSLRGVLATGAGNVQWIIDRGMPSDKVFPFAYFLAQKTRSFDRASSVEGPFRFLFVGQLVIRKRLSELIETLSVIKGFDFELCVVGAGVEETKLKKLASERLGNRVRWLGPLKISEVPPVMANADCLVLPSIHDGWGAVASEAILVGTPVICSDSCGVAEVVQCSQEGGVFRKNLQGLEMLLINQLALGKISTGRRQRLAEWGRCLNASTGAKYLRSIIASSRIDGAKPNQAPWKKP